MNKIYIVCFTYAFCLTSAAHSGVRLKLVEDHVNPSTVVSFFSNNPQLQGKLLGSLRKSEPNIEIPYIYPSVLVTYWSGKLNCGQKSKEIDLKNESEYKVNILKTGPDECSIEFSVELLK